MCVYAGSEMQLLVTSNYHSEARAKNSNNQLEPLHFINSTFFTDAECFLSNHFVTAKTFFLQFPGRILKTKLCHVKTKMQIENRFYMHCK